MSLTLRKRSPWEIQRAVLFALLMREIKTRFGGRLIGLFWVLFEPVVNIYVLLFIRNVLRVRMLGPTIQYPVYHVCAMIPYFIFRSCWFRTMEAVSGNLGLFAYRQVKPMDAMIARSWLEMYIYAWVFVCVMGTLWWFGYKFFPDNPILFLTCWTLQIFLGFGVGMCCLVIGHDRPNVKTIIRLISMPLYLLSGILIPLASFPPNILWWLMWNPCAHLVEMERVSYFHEYIPVNGTSLTYAAMCALVTCALGQVLYRRNRLKLLQR